MFKYTNIQNINCWFFQLNANTFCKNLLKFYLNYLFKNCFKQINEILMADVFSQVIVTNLINIILNDSVF